MRKFYLFLLILLACSPLWAQITVTGIVTDDTGLSIPGVTIVVKNNPALGTITDLDGIYSIQVVKNAVLRFTYIGYETQEITIGTKNQQLNVVLHESSLQIDEVVVTAIGIKQEKKKLGYTTQQVKTEALEQAGTVNVGNALSGQIAGLTVTNPTGLFQSPSFSLRGKTPLIVVDGIPVSTDLYDVSPENIANINVLKGTAAAALYGSRGKDGAILITTKTASEEGLVVTAGLTSMMTAGFAVFPETQHEYGSGSNGKYEFWDGADGGISDGDMTWGPALDGRLIAQWNSPIRNKETGETLDWYGDVLGSQYDDRSKYERVPIPFVQHDNLSNFMRTGILTKATFSVANKTRKSSYNLVGDFAYQKGQVPNTEVLTGGLNFNGTWNLSHNVMLSAKLNYNKVYSPNYPRYGYGPKNHMYTILLWMSDDVDVNQLKNNLWRKDKVGYRQANYNYAWYNNPYFGVSELTQVHDRSTTDGLIKLNWDIVPGLSVQGRTSAHLVNTFANMQSPKSYMNYGDSRNGDYKIWNTNDLDVNSDLLATWTCAFSEDYSYTINAGSSLYYHRDRNGYQQTDGLIVPSVYNMGNSLNPVRTTNYFGEHAIESLYGSVNIDLWNSLFFTFTGRNDWSSTLSADNNSYFYPSVSASTLVSNYVKMPSWIDYLKVNSAWAQVSSDLSAYSLSATYNNSVLWGSSPSVSYGSNTLLNAEILPQKTTSFEVGTSIAFFKGRLSADLTYYHMLDQNQIISLPISQASGYSSRFVNGNEYSTNGFEAVFGVIPLRNKYFTWKINLNASTNIRKLTKIYNNQEKYGYLSVGDRSDAMYRTVWEKSADNQLILDENGMPTRNSFPVNIGHASPNFRYGFQNEFKIKDFTVNIDLDGALGGTLVSTTIQKYWWSGKHPKSTMYRAEEYANGGTPIFVPEGVQVVSGSVQYDTDGSILSDTREYKPNTTAVNIQTWAQNYPYRAVVTEKESEIFANTYDRSYMKLRRIAISYDLNNLLALDHIENLKITLFGNNLAVIKNLPYLDPDFGSSDSSLQDPSARYIGISANIKF